MFSGLKLLAMQLPLNSSRGSGTSEDRQEAFIFLSVSLQSFTSFAFPLYLEKHRQFLSGSFCVTEIDMVAGSFCCEVA